MKKKYFVMFAMTLWFLLGTVCLYAAKFSNGNKGEQALLLFSILSYAMSFLCFCVSPRFSAQKVHLPAWNHTIYEAMAQRIIHDAKRHRERSLVKTSSP